METVPLQLEGGRLEVNVDAAAGSLAVEALSASGEPLPGLTLEDCQAVQSDGVRQAVRWRGEPRLPVGQPVRLRFLLQNARLYSFRIRQAAAP